MHKHIVHKRKEKNKMKKTLSPKLDVVFQALFGEVKIQY